MDKKISLIMHKLIGSMGRLADTDQLDTLINEYLPQLNDLDFDESEKFMNEYRKIATELIVLRRADAEQTAVALTEKEQAELRETEHIIDENLFDYHFQPIVNATDGTIYSYEALMRPKSSICPSPFHIIKYAELTDRLNDIERSTFLNILGIIDSDTEAFCGRKVFINSIPEAELSDEDVSRINILLGKHSQSVVVEMTEQSELDDSKLESIKELYQKLNVQIAVDDYGTGYSNVQNLLRYVPNFVKIDRSLISGIQNDAKKMHFVREIIEFCHDNDIYALAEGVETSDEMRTVIHLGADLIQGYYTARPAAEIIDAIPYEIRQEISAYHQERVDGRMKHIYSAEKNERVILERLMREEYDCVLVGSKGDCDVTIASSPGSKSTLHINVANGFKGNVILENSVLSNIMDRPCIDIGENCDVKIVLIGMNKLNGGGIRVPESSKLTISGDGLLNIYVDAGAFYAIGNDQDSRHGELMFEQGVNIENNSVSGICIGSGQGGKITIMRGKFTLGMTGTYGVGIGSFTADTELYLFACDITLDAALINCAGFGTFEGCCKVYMHHSSVKMRLSGSDVVGIGTLAGKSCTFETEESSTSINIAAPHSSGIAALDGDTSFSISKAAINITVSGERTLAIGGFGGNTEINTTYTDVTVRLSTKINLMDYIKKENVHITGGRTLFVVNETEMAAP